MTLEGFMKFCRDFSLFPDVISKPKIASIFTILANTHQPSPQEAIAIINLSKDGVLSQTKTGHLDGKLGVVDQHLFIEMIALCAFEAYDGDHSLSNLEKVNNSIININSL